MSRYMVVNPEGELMSSHATRKKAFAKAKRCVAAGTRRCAVLLDRYVRRPTAKALHCGTVVKQPEVFVRAFGGRP